MIESKLEKESNLKIILTAIITFILTIVTIATIVYFTIIVVTPDEGKLLYFQGQEDEGDGFDNISMNIACDESELIEK